MRPRIRTVKPEFFGDEKLWELHEETGLPVQLAFIGLWCAADREGRFEWRPRMLRSFILPYWEGDFERVLDALASRSLVVKYEVDGKPYGVVRTFKDHQVINNKEQASALPGPDEHATPTRSSRVGFVYLATLPGAKHFKVGFSMRDPSSRLNDLSCGSPEPLILIEKIAGNIALETQIHQALVDHRNHREWFHATDESIRVLSAWFTRDPRESVQENLSEGEGKGREGIRNGNGNGKAVVLPPPDDPPRLKQSSRELGTFGAPALKFDWDPDWLPSREHQARGFELGLTDDDIGRRLFDCQHKTFAHGFKSEDHQFMRELGWEANDKKVRLAKEARSGTNWEKPGAHRQRGGA